MPAKSQEQEWATILEKAKLEQKGGAIVKDIAVKMRLKDALPLDKQAELSRISPAFEKPTEKKELPKEESAETPPAVSGQKKEPPIQNQKPDAENKMPVKKVEKKPSDPRQTGNEAEPEEQKSDDWRSPKAPTLPEKSGRQSSDSGTDKEKKQAKERDHARRLEGGRLRNRDAQKKQFQEKQNQEEQMKGATDGEKKGHRIGFSTAFAMLAVAIFFDGAQVVLAITIVIGWIISGVAWITFFLWLRSLGMKWSEGRQAQKMVLLLLGATIAEIIPILNMLPAWTLFVGSTILFDRRREKIEQMNKGKNTQGLISKSLGKFGAVKDVYDTATGG